MFSTFSLVLINCITEKPHALPFELACVVVELRKKKKRESTNSLKSEAPQDRGYGSADYWTYATQNSQPISSIFLTNISSCTAKKFRLTKLENMTHEIKNDIFPAAGLYDLRG